MILAGGKLWRPYNWAERLYAKPVTSGKAWQRETYELLLPKHSKMR